MKFITSEEFGICKDDIKNCQYDPPCESCDILARLLNCVLALKEAQGVIDHYSHCECVREFDRWDLGGMARAWQEKWRDE